MSELGFDWATRVWQCRRRMLAGAAMVATLLFTLLTLVLSSDQIRWLRVHLDWLNWVMGVLENASTHLNLIHLILFFALGVTAAGALPRWPSAKLIAIGVALALGTEVLQFAIPGRQPRVSDVLLDIVSAAAGVLAVRLASRLQPKP